MQETDKNLLKAIGSVMRPITENENSESEQFEDDLDNLLNSHHCALTSAEYLDNAGGAPELSAAVNALAEKHLAAGKAHWDAHPQFHDGRSFDDAAHSSGVMHNEVMGDEHRSRANSGEV